jgi:hypothetical protein
MGEDKSERGIFESTDDIASLAMTASIAKSQEVQKTAGSLSNNIDEQLKWLEKELSLVDN